MYINRTDTSEHKDPTLNGALVTEEDLMKLVQISREKEGSMTGTTAPSNEMIIDENDTTITITMEGSSAVDLQSTNEPLRPSSLQNEQKSRGNTIPSSNDSVMNTTPMPSKCDAIDLTTSTTEQKKMSYNTR